MNGQSRAFAKQVQVDLLALCDADLFNIIHQWVSGSNPSRSTFEVPEDTRFSLGYTHVLAETETLPYLHCDALGAESNGSAQWHAPLPHQLRTLLTAMEVDLFAQHVITLAFQSLHTTYPEWYEGLTFNAHLANYLRQMNKKRRTLNRTTSEV
jgi:hypothetical protein